MDAKEREIRAAQEEQERLQRLAREAAEERARLELKNQEGSERARQASAHARPHAKMMS